MNLAGIDQTRLSCRSVDASGVAVEALRPRSPACHHHHMANGGVAVEVLGPFGLRVVGAVVPIAGPKQRALLAMLALHANQVVPVSSLVDVVWGDPAPDRAEHTLQQHVSAVRKLLESGRDTPEGARVLVTRSP